MSGTDPPDALVEAIEEHPETVAGLLARLDTFNQLLDTIALAEAGLDDEAVERLTETGTTLGLAAEGLATEETARLGETVGAQGESLAGALDSLGRLERDGTLDDLASAGELVSLMRAAMDDEMVESVVTSGSAVGELADTATDPAVKRGLDGMLTAVGETERAESEPIGTLGLLRATRDPDVRAGLGYLLSLSRAIGRQQAEDSVE